MKKIIGVMPLWDDDRESIWMLPGYLDGIKAAGALPVIFPFLENESDILELCRMCDGFLFTGGHDVAPEIYGEAAEPGMIESCAYRDTMEQVVFKYALDNDKAVLGICRGIQFINAYAGGSLYQDVETFHPSDVDHRMKAPYDRACHDVNIVKDSELYKLLGKDVIGVNSCHHQAVKVLAPAAKAMAISPDGIIEALSIEGKKFVWAVQWHPEFFGSKDINSCKLFKAFVEHC